MGTKTYQMNESSKIAIIGGGSWATAIAKILRENKVELNWYMRNIDTSSQFKKLGIILAT